MYLHFLQRDPTKGDILNCQQGHREENKKKREKAELSAMLLSFFAAFSILIFTSSASRTLNSETLKAFNIATGLQALEFFERFTAKQVETSAHSQLHRPVTSLRSERLAAEILLDGYFFVDDFSDDTCSTYVKGTSVKLNSCISNVCATTVENGCSYDKNKAHYIVTATSTSVKISYYNDFKCTEKSSFSADESATIRKDCTSRAKEYVSASYLLQYPVSYVTNRQEICEHLRYVW